MGTKSIHRILSKAFVMPEENIDTDQIIPSRFLKATDRIGFGKNLFYDWRYQEDGSEKKDFVLNKFKTDPAGLPRKILIAGHNFGCGSSREHAAWALYDFEIRVVISSFFADIFLNNSLNNFLLPIQVSADTHAYLIPLFQKSPELEIQVDLSQQIWSIPHTKETYSFEISAYKKTCLLNGYDDLDYVISHKKEIFEFEKQRLHEKKYFSYSR